MIVHIAFTFYCIQYKPPTCIYEEKEIDIIIDNNFIANLPIRVHEKT